MQKANCVIVDPFDDPFNDPIVEPFVIVVLSVDPMSVVRVRLLMAVHPQEDEQGVQSVVLDISANSQGKTFKLKKNFLKNNLDNKYFRMTYAYFTIASSNLSKTMSKKLTGHRLALTKIW